MRRLARPLALLLLALPLAACGDDEAAVEDEPVVVAFLRAVAGVPSTEPAFVGALRNAGYIEGQNLTLLAADADEAYPDPEAAAEAVRGWVEDDGVDLIVALSSTGARIAADTAPETDVLFLSTDPTATGLVEDEDAPEGNLTGVSFRVPADRTLSLLQRAIPDLDRVGLAFPPSDPAALAHRDVVVAAAAEVGLELSLAEFTDGNDVAAAIETLAAEGVDALLVSTSPVATRALAETSAAAADAGLPLMANTTVAEAALLSLSADTEELGRQLGRQAARLLAGEATSTVPVEDPNRFVLTLNRSVAGELGITFDPGLLREADDVIG